MGVGFLSRDHIIIIKSNHQLAWLACARHCTDECKKNIEHCCGDWECCNLVSRVLRFKVPLSCEQSNLKCPFISSPSNLSLFSFILLPCPIDWVLGNHFYCTQLFVLFCSNICACSHAYVPISNDYGRFEHVC